MHEGDGSGHPTGGPPTREVRPLTWKLMTTASPARIAPLEISNTSSSLAQDPRSEPAASSSASHAAVRSLDYR